MTEPVGGPNHLVMDGRSREPEDFAAPRSFALRYAKLCLDLERVRAENAFKEENRSPNPRDYDTVARLDRARIALLAEWEAAET